MQLISQILVETGQKSDYGKITNDWRVDGEAKKAYIRCYLNPL
jgi:hypothetical protein